LAPVSGSFSARADVHHTALAATSYLRIADADILKRMSVSVADGVPESRLRDSV